MMIEKILKKHGCSIHYWILDNKSDIWIGLLHGAGTDHNMFDAQFDVLKAYNILAWDARGHGKSKPIGDSFSIKLLIDDLIAIMDNENIKSITLIGQSMGGNVAQEMVFYHPDKVENLVLIDCTCNTMELSHIEKLSLGIAPFLVKMYPWNAIVNQSAKLSSVKPETQSYLINTFKTVGRKNFNKIFLEVAACLHYEKNYKINKPILLVCGEYDNTGNIKKIAPIWAENEPKCEFHWIKNAGHCSNQDNKEMFNALLIKFLKSIYTQLK